MDSMEDRLVNQLRLQIDAALNTLQFGRDVVERSDPLLTLHCLAKVLIDQGGAKALEHSAVQFMISMYEHIQRSTLYPMSDRKRAKEELEELFSRFFTDFRKNRKDPSETWIRDLQMLNYYLCLLPSKRNLKLLEKSCPHNDERRLLHDSLHSASEIIKKQYRRSFIKARDLKDALSRKSLFFAGYEMDAPEGPLRAATKKNRPRGIALAIVGLVCNVSPVTARDAIERARKRLRNFTPRSNDLIWIQFPVKIPKVFKADKE